MKYMLNFEDFSDMAWAIGITIFKVDGPIDMILYQKKNYFFSTKMEDRWRILESLELIKITAFDQYLGGWFWILTPLGKSFVKEFCKTDPSYRIQKITEISKKICIDP